MSHSERPAALNSPKLIRGQQDPCVIPAEMSGATIIAIELQWGRDQLIAEIIFVCLGSCFSCLLQWGRDQLIAEIYSAAFALRLAKSRLQWGRDQLIAEMT